MTRYEKEIKDILEKIEDFLPPGQEPSEKRKQPGILDGLKRRIAGIRLTFSPGQIFVTGLVLVTMAFILSFFSRGLTIYVGLAGGLLMALAYVLFLLGKQTRRQEKRWRGRIIDLEERRQGSWRYYWWRIKRMFGRR